MSKRTEKPNLEGQSCSKRIFSGERWDFNGHSCARKAAIQEGGKWYCKQHSPTEEAARRAASRDRFEAVCAADRREWAIAEAKEAIIKTAKAWAQPSGPDAVARTEALFGAVANLLTLEAR